jgi:putative drug exporter of the RND superfamily
MVPGRRVQQCVRHGNHAARTGPRPSIVERVAGWSARHRKIAVFGWLLLVIAAVGIGHQLGTRNLNSYDQGQAGRAERVLARPVVQQPDSESVLIQGRSAAQTYAGDAEVRQAVRQVVAALRAVPPSATDIRSPLTTRGLVRRCGSRPAPRGAPSWCPG